MKLLRAALFLLVCAGVSRGEDFLPGVRRIVFLGDSITYSGQTIDLFEAFLFTRFPQREFEVINVGLPSETVSGLSEEGHAGGKFPRPGLHERLDRVLAQTKPDLVFACYGMNDGIYLPLSEERFAKYRDGIAKLREKTLAAGAKIIHLTPPVFDAEPIKARVAEAAKADGNHPFAGYDDVLDRYSAWLLEQRAAQGWTVIDIHGPMKAELARRRAERADFRFAGDGVHPDAAGHAVMAHALLAGLGQSIDGFASEELVKLVRQRGRIIADAWLNATGHQRPGMAKGLPLDEAKAKAAELEKQIRAVVSAR